MSYIILDAHTSSNFNPFSHSMIWIKILAKELYKIWSCLLSLDDYFWWKFLNMLVKVVKISLKLKTSLSSSSLLAIFLDKLYIQNSSTPAIFSILCYYI